MWPTCGVRFHANRTRYLTYGLAYYLFAVVVLVNLSHRTRPPSNPTIVLLGPTKPSTQPRAILVSPSPDRFARLARRANNVSRDKEAGFYALRPRKVHDFPFDAVIRPDVICSPDVYMIILVHSHHPNFAKRKAIRETWGSTASGKAAWPADGLRLKRKTRLLFILGVHKDPGLNDQLWEESVTHKDIIQGNFADSYRNMTLKSLLGLKVLQEFCSKAEYLLKCDDDMFLNLPHFINTLDKKPLRHSILGPLSVNARVYRSGKWKLTKEEFPFDRLPPYESGAAYVISSDLWRDLFTASFFVPRIHIDDVYVTGILGKILNVTHVVLPGFAFWNSKVPSICDIKKNKIFSSTKMTPDILCKTWKDLSNKEPCK